MSIPISQAVRIASYVLAQKYIKRRRRYPLVLMLEPLLECAGCGKIQFPDEILKKSLTSEQCLRAVDEFGPQEPT